eukprot:g2649.t1
MNGPRLEEEDYESLAYFLLAKREGCDVVTDPEKLFPLSNIDEAYAIHKYMTKTMSTLGKHAGWKCGACTKAAWTNMGLSGPFRAPLFSRRLYNSPAQTNKVDNNVFLLEAEFAFMMSKNLPPRDNQPYTTKEVWDAVALIAPAIEIVGSRWSGTAMEHCNNLHKIADGGVNVGAVLGRGTPVNEARKDLDAVEVTFLVNDKIFSIGSGKNVLDHPIKSLTWLANNLCNAGISTQDSTYGGSGPGLAKGDVIMSGACCVLNEFQIGDTIRADFGEFGCVEVFIGGSSINASKL